MPFSTPEELERGVENLTRLLNQLVSDMERLKTDVAEMRAAYNAHTHLIDTDAATGDGSASASAGTPT